MFCALLMSRYQVSVYRTNGPLVISVVNKRKHVVKAITHSHVSICAV